jgi:hypothetical protein
MRQGFRSWTRTGLAALFVVAAPIAASAAEPPLESAPAAPGDSKPAPAEPEKERPPPAGERLVLPPLGFDVLGAPELPPAPVDEGKMRWRRRFLQWHQGVSLGVFGLTLTTTVVGGMGMGIRHSTRQRGR